MDIPGDSEGKTSAYNVGDPSLIPGSGRSPGKRNGNPLQYSCLKNHGWRSLVHYTPWGHKQSDMPERLHFHFHNQIHTYIYESESCSVISNSLQPHRLTIQSVEFSRPQY